MSRKPLPTHFLCLPLVTSSSRAQLHASLARFAAEVSKPNENGKPRIPPKAVRPVGTIHFTIGVMSLQNSERIQEACEFLKNLDIGQLTSNSLSSDFPNYNEPSSPRTQGQRSTSLDQPLAALLSQEDRVTIASTRPESLTIALTGLLPMRSATSTSVLYASPEPLHPILTFARRLHDVFLAAGYLLPPPGNRPLQLHATLVNTIYVKRSIGSGKNRWGKGSEKIDAREVIEQWKETTWIKDVRLEKLSICEIGAKKVEDGRGEVADEVYIEVASVALP